MAGFRPAISRSRSERVKQTTLHSDGGTGGYRDRDTDLFRVLLYHSELQCRTKLVDQEGLESSNFTLQG